MTLNLVLLHPQESAGTAGVGQHSVCAVLGGIAETCSMESTYHFSALPPGWHFRRDQLSFVPVLHRAQSHHTVDLPQEGVCAPNPRPGTAAGL